MVETVLIACDRQTDIRGKQSDFVDGGNGCLYGIPKNARRVIEFTVNDKSVKEIGPHLGFRCEKYKNGIQANNGSIYCMPHETKHFLNIIPAEGKDTEVQIIEKKQYPKGRWIAGALARDGCIYYLPWNDYGRILKLNPNDGDNLSLVGEEIGGRFIDAVLGNDGCIYGITLRRIIKFSPIDFSVSYVGRSFEGINSWKGLVSAEDGNIYAANKQGQILLIDIPMNDWKVIGNTIFEESVSGWAPLCLVLTSAFIFLLHGIIEFSNSIQAHKMYR